MDELIDSKLAMSSSRVDRGKSIEVNESPKRLEERLSNCRQPPRQPFLYRVHKYYLRDSNDNAHEPRMVAIGPYHHGKQSLKIMEEHKLRYLKSLLLRKDHKVDRYISAIAEIEEEVRSCYAEELSFSSTEFVEMLVLDGCFIIELSRKSWMYDQGDQGETSDDPIFQMEWWFLIHLTDDLILFENQIPFFVLCKLFDLIHEEVPTPKQQPLLIRWIFNLLGLEETNITNEVPVMHLLHLKHATERPSPSIYINLKECPQWKFQSIPPATVLNNANVIFRCSYSRMGPFEADFSNGVLTMSTLKMHDDVEHDLRNLILYEQYFPSNRPTYVTDYVKLLDCLINSGQDVEILFKYGIIGNLTGHYQVAADIINRLAQSVRASPRYFIHAGTCSEIKAHHMRPWNSIKTWDTLRREWAYISFVAALLLLLLTVAQTVFSAIQL